MKKTLYCFALGCLLFAGCKKNETVTADPSSGIAPAVMPEQPAEEDPGTVMIGPPPLPETNTPPPANGQYPAMQFDKTEHDFGKIAAGSKVSYTFNFTNSGQSDLIITNAVGSCGCTVPEFPKAPVKPGASGKILVTFNSAGKQGNQHKTVTLATNTVNGKEILHIKASINPADGQ